MTINNVQFNIIQLLSNREKEKKNKSHGKKIRDKTYIFMDGINLWS